MQKTDSRPDVDEVMRAAARVLHPTKSAHYVLANRVTVLERQVAYLARRVDVLVDLLNSDDE